MAKTRQDFINEGRANAIKMQAPIGSVPEFANSGSWQAKAYLEGWNLGAQDHAESFAKVLEQDTLQMKTLRNQAQTRHFKTEYGVKQSPKQTAQKHVEMLRHEAMTIFNSKRQNRLFAKAAKLSAKWGL